MKITRIAISFLIITLIWTLFIIIYPIAYSKYIFGVPAFSNNEIIQITNDDDSTSFERVLVLGDSTSIGQGTSEFKENFSYMYLENTNSNYEYLNLGFSGATSQDVVNSQLSKIAEFDPDIVFLSLGSNDVIKFYENTDFNSNISKITNYAISTKAEVVWMNIPNFMTAPTILPPLNIFFNSRAQDLNGKIKSNCLKIESSKCIDVYNKTYDDFKRNPDKYFSKDKFHPSKKGYELWASLIIDNK